MSTQYFNSIRALIVAGVRINFGQVAQLTSMFSKAGSYS